jgi:hypothetical protein
MFRDGEDRPQIVPIGHARSKSLRSSASVTLRETQFEVGDIMLIEKIKVSRK